MNKETHHTIYKICFGIAVGWFILDFIQTWLWSYFFLYLHQHPNTLIILTTILLLSLAIHVRWKDLNENNIEEPEPTLLKTVDDIIKGDE